MQYVPQELAQQNPGAVPWPGCLAAQQLHCDVLFHIDWGCNVRNFADGLSSTHLPGSLLITTATLALASATTALAPAPVATIFCSFSCSYDWRHAFQYRCFNCYARWARWAFSTRFLRFWRCLCRPFVARRSFFFITTRFVAWSISIWPVTVWSVPIRAIAFTVAARWIIAARFGDGWLCRWRFCAQRF